MSIGMIIDKYINCRKGGYGTVIDNIESEDQETRMMQLIVRSGNAKSKAIESIKLARNGDFTTARKLYEEACNDLSEAHKFQADMIQDEAGGKHIPLTLLVLHAQDHLMNAITVKDLAKEFIDLYSKIGKSLS